VRDAQGLHLVDQDQRVIFSGAPCAREKMPGGPCLVHFGGTNSTDALWTFETSETQVAFAMIGGTDDGWLSHLEAWHPRLFAVVAVCIFAGFVIWRWGLDFLAFAAIAVTPPAFVEAIDRGNLAAMDRLFAAPTELSVSDQDMVQEIFDNIVAVAPEAPFGSYHLEFRDISQFGPNAFALPGGTVVVTDILVDMFPDPNVLAGILGHELAHVSEQHSLHQLYRSVSTYVVIAMLAGDVGPILEEVLLEGSAIASLAFSREHESDADAIGIRTSALAGYEPAALANFFTELSEEGGIGAPEWMSTHPSNEDRIETILDLAAEQELAQ
jgi:Zn-dependent protease with chaperone function